MSMLLRSMLVLGVAGLLVVGCGKKEEAAPVVAAPAVVAPAAPAVVAPAAEPAATGGGYEPTAEERVPGITLDPAAPAADAAPAEAAPAAK
jgi:hypothetical protein